MNGIGDINVDINARINAMINAALATPSGLSPAPVRSAMNGRRHA